MRQIKFLGHVSPRSRKITIHDGPRVFIYNLPELGEVTVRATIIESQIEIECTAEHFPEDYKLTLWIASLGIAQTLLNLLAFKAASGIIIVLDAHQLPGGEVTFIDWADPSLLPYVTSLSTDSDINRVLALLASEPRLISAMNDLVATLTNPFFAFINCARCLEVIRIAVCGDLFQEEKDKPRAWEHLRKQLNFDRPFTQLIMDNSLGPRHGNPTPPEPGVMAEVMRRSWIVMDRFLHYRRLGSAQLPVEDFPVLNG